MSDEAARNEEELRQMRGVKGVSQKLSVFKQLERQVLEEEGKKGLAVPAPVRDNPSRASSAKPYRPDGDAPVPAPNPVDPEPPKRQFRRNSQEKVNPLEVSPGGGEELPSMPKRQFKRQLTETQPDPAAAPAPAQAVEEEPAPPRRQFKRGGAVDPIAESQAQPQAAPVEEAPADVVPKRQFKRNPAPSESSPSSSAPSDAGFEELRRDIEAKMSALERRAEELEDERSKLEVEKSDLHLERTKLAGERQTLQALASQNALKDKGSDELNELREELEEMREDLDAQKEVFDHHREQFNQAKQHFETEKVKLQEEKKVLEARVAELEKEKQLVAQQREAVTKERDAFNADKQKYISQQDQSQRGGLQVAEDQRLKMQAEREKLDNERVQFERQKSAFAAEMAALETTRALVANQKAEVEAQQAKLALKQLQQSDSPVTSPRVGAAQIIAADGDLAKKLERKTKELSKTKSELKKSKKLQLETVQQNNLLLAEMQKKDKANERQEKKLQNEIKAQKAKLKDFFTEREQLKDEKKHWEDTKLALDDAPAPAIPVGNWNDPNFVKQQSSEVQKEKMKVNVVKRYVETERKRFIEVKRVFEQQQAEFLERKKKELETAAEKEGEKERATVVADSMDEKKVKHSKSSRHAAKSKSSKPKKSNSEIEPLTGAGQDTPPAGIQPTPQPATSSSTFVPATPSPLQNAAPAGVSASSTPASSNTSAQSLPSGPVELPATFVTDGFDLDRYDVVAMLLDQLKVRIERGEEDDMASIRVDEQTNEIFSSSLRGLLRAICSQEENEDFHTTLLMTYDYFMSPAQLLRVLILFHRSPSISSTVSDVPEHQRRQVYQARLIEFLNLWQTLRFEVLQFNQEWQQLFNQFLALLNGPEGNTSHAISLTEMNRNLVQQWGYYRERQRGLMLKTPPGPPNSVQLLYISAQQLAEQLTLREQSYFQSIQMSEYYNKAWETGDSRAPNLSKLITRFADMSFWVATTILSAKGVDGKPSETVRAQTLSRFIHTLNELYTMNNFNTLMQVYTALNMPVIDRLRRSWALVPKQDKEILKRIGTLMHHSNNYKKYREALDAIEDEACIPFHSLLLRDLTFIEEDVTFIDDAFVNFEKLTLVSQIFERLQDFRLQLYDIEEDAAIQQFLHNKIVKTQEELEALSKAFGEDDGDASAESTPDAGMTEETLMKQYGIGSLNVVDCLRVPELFQQFKGWLKSQSVVDQNHLDCWMQLNEFVRADVGSSEYGALALREMAEDIFSLFLTPQGTKYIGDVPDEITRELADHLGSDQPVTKRFFDEVIAGVLERLEFPWNDFKAEVLLK